MTIECMSKGILIKHVAQLFAVRFKPTIRWRIAFGPTRRDDDRPALFLCAISSVEFWLVEPFLELRGHFPDGAVLVKEVFATSTNEMTTGTVSHADKLKGWFVMMKDSKETHPGNPLWGDGWGWSWFDADKPLKTTSTEYHTDCQGCHVPAKATDWIYVNGYPVLHH